MTDVMVSPAGMRVVKLLVGHPPQTITDLTSAAGVTRTAVTEQLNELVAAGFVDRSTERLPGRGRPRHVYSATDAAMILLFCKNQRVVVPAIWRAVQEIGGDELTEQVVDLVSRALADHYNRKIHAKTPRERLRELTEVLCEEGGLVEAVEENGNLLMRKRTCPFISILDDAHSVCCVDMAMMSEVVGSPIKRTACRHEGDPCCIIEIADE